MPRARNAAASISPANGSVVGTSRGPRCRIVIAALPSACHAVAISQATTPPPRITSRRGAALGARRLAARPGTRRGEPGNRRDRGAGAGRDHDRVARAQLDGRPCRCAGPRPVRRADDDAALTREPAVPAHEIDVGVVEPAHLAVVLPVGGERVATGEDGGGVERAGDGLTRAVDGARVGERLRRAQERLARHAGPVEHSPPTSSTRR